MPGLPSGARVALPLGIGGGTGGKYIYQVNIEEFRNSYDNL